MTKIEVDKKYFFQVIGKLESLEKRLVKQERLGAHLLQIQKDPAKKTINDFTKLLIDNKLVEKI